MYCNFIIGRVDACKDNLRDSDSNNMATCITIELPLEALWLQFLLFLSTEILLLYLLLALSFAFLPRKSFTVRTWITS